MVSQLLSTVYRNTSANIFAVQLNDSIASLSVAITTLVTDLDNVVGGVETAVTNLLKNIPISVSILNTTVNA